MQSFFLLCDIYFDPLLCAEQSDMSLAGRDEGSRISTVIIKLFYTYFSWHIAYYNWNVFLL